MPFACSSELFALVYRIEARFTMPETAAQRLTPLGAKAFRSELVPPDPADELLKHLAATGTEAPADKRALTRGIPRKTA